MSAAAELILEKYIFNLSKKEKKDRKQIEKLERKSPEWTICKGNRMPQ